MKKKIFTCTNMKRENLSLDKICSKFLEQIVKCFNNFDGQIGFEICMVEADRVIDYRLEPGLESKEMVQGFMSHIFDQHDQEDVDAVLIAAPLSASNKEGAISASCSCRFCQCEFHIPIRDDGKAILEGRTTEMKYKFKKELTSTLCMN